MKFTIPEIDEAKGGTMEVEGELVASAVGTYHTLQVISCGEDDAYTVVVISFNDYTQQFTMPHYNVRKVLTKLTLWSIYVDKPPQFLKEACEAARLRGLDAQSVFLDFHEQMKSLMAQLQEVSA
jgi:hypothetical protein